MVRPYTSVETENRTAFVVQLNALLGSLDAVISVNASTKTKLAAVQTAVDEWREAIGPVQVSKPYALPTPTPAPPVTDRIASAGTDAVAASTTGKSDEVAHAVPSAEAPAESESSPRVHTTAAATAMGEDEATTIGSKTIVDLVDFISLLYTSGLPESAKLRAVAKGVARLLIVRCTTIVYATLQHAARLTYHSSKSPEETLEVFVIVSRDLRRTTTAMVRCLELICSFAEFTDVASVRFAQQVCIDALRNVRRAMLNFQTRIDREETMLLARELHIGSGGGLARTSHADSGVDLLEGPGHDVGQSPHVNDDTFGSTTAPLPTPEELRARGAQRAAWLRATWGVSLVNSIVKVGRVMSPAVRFLVSIAGVKEVSGPPGIAALKQDAQADLFALGSPSAPSPKETALVDPMTAASGNSDSKNPSKTDLDDDNHTRGAAGEPENGSDKGGAPPGVAVKKTAQDAANVVAAAAALVLPLVGFNFSAECLAVMSENSGDESDGKLVATRIVTDTLRVLSETQPELLHAIVQGEGWKQRLFTGILNCLVSLHPAVLEAGLSDLHLIVTCCPSAIGTEVGYLYNNCLLKLLESENSPIYTKKEIIIHIVMTLLVGCPTVAAPTAHVPLLLHLYRLYDLNEGAHKLNVVQQFVAALSRIVRSAALTEFTPIVAEGDAQGGSGATPLATSSSTDGGKLSLELQAARHATLPSLALRGLVLLVEVLSTQTLPEDDAWTRDLSTQLPTLNCRERKREGQRHIDVFVAAPKKGIQKIFDVSAEEFSPAGHDDFAAEWDHTKCPSPATPALDSKVDAVTDFLMNVTSTCPDEVAEFLTTPAVFSLQVCARYMSRLPLAGCRLVDAIQVLLAHVELPKEGQRIERLLEYFSAAYFAANNVPGIDRTVFPFQRDDTCFVVIVATVMLNTDLHNPLSSSRMNQKNFRSQLKACDKVITDAYADDIFFSISRHPLKSAKSLSAASAAATHAGGLRGAVAGTAPESYYRFDALFISVEERRKLAFGMEQQRLVSETVASWQCAIPSLGAAPTDWQWWCGVARDLFTCTWPSVCAVFGPAMYQQNASVAVPNALLLECIRGLKALMCVAAAFALPTECEVTLLALLGLCDHASVRATCRVAILQVASTGYAVHLTTRCWTHVLQLLACMRTELQPSAMPPQVEGVLALIERVTSTSYADASATHTTASAAANTDLHEEGGEEGSEAAAESASVSATAVHRVVEGVLDVLKTCKKGDARTLAAGLYLLRRVLQFSRITHSHRSSDVATFVNVRDCAHMVVPRLVALVARQSSSEEALQSIFGTIVDLLTAIWKAHTPESNAGAGAGARRTSTPTLADVVECYNVLRGCYEKHSKCELVKGYVLQAIQELMGRTLRQLPGAHTSTSHHHRGRGSPQVVRLMLELWRRVLCPVAMAVSLRDAADAQTASLAVLVLRKVVVLTCGSQRTMQLPTPCQTVALVLLTDVAFIGALSGNVDVSQACLAQLTTLCSGCLTREAGSALTPATSSSALSPPQSPRVHHEDGQRVGRPGQHGDDGSDRSQAASGHAVVNLVVQMLVSECGAQVDSRGSPNTNRSSATSADVQLASYGMERLCLLTRAASEQARGDSITNLRTLCLQLKPAHVGPLAERVCGLVMEGLRGAGSLPSASASQATSRTALSPSVRQSFDMLLMDVPAAVTPCTGETFNATLPALLHLLTHDLLGMAEATQLGTVSRRVIQECLTPVCAAAPGTVASSTRSAAIKSLVQCAALCLARFQASTAAVPTVSAAPDGVPCDVTLYFPVRAFLDATALTLLQLRVPVERVVPADAAIPGETHWDLVVDQLADRVDTFQSEAVTAHAQAEAEAEAAVAAALADREAVGAKGNGAQPVQGVNGYASTAAARAAAAGLGVFSRFGGVMGEGPLSDDTLVECSTQTAQLLSGLPHILSVILPVVTGRWGGATPTEDGDSGPASKIPHASPEVLLALLLDSARQLFAMQWRACHTAEMAEFCRQALAKGGEAPAVVVNASLLPHTAVRGVLNSYLELAVFTPGQDREALLEVLLGILEGLGTAQQMAANGGSVSQRRLNAQEQQHVRTCSAGMYQELSIVLACWMKTLTVETSAASDGHASPHIPPTRVQALEAVALDSRLFLALASLLTPTAGPLIVTVRDFFAWYISKNGLRPPAAPSNSMSALHLPASRDAIGKAAAVEPAAHVQAAPLSANHRRGRASFVLESDDEP